MAPDLLLILQTSINKGSGAWGFWAKVSSDEKNQKHMALEGGVLPGALFVYS